MDDMFDGVIHEFCIIIQQLVNLVDFSGSKAEFALDLWAIIVCFLSTEVVVIPKTLCVTPVCIITVLALSTMV